MAVASDYFQYHHGLHKDGSSSIEALFTESILQYAENVQECNTPSCPEKVNPPLYGWPSLKITMHLVPLVAAF